MIRLGFTPLGFTPLGFTPLGFAAALALLGPACGPADACEDGACTCTEVSDDGVCCDGFLELGESGRCVARAWPPTQREALGEPGAKGVEVAVDGEGRALVSWQRLGAGLARPVLHEETDEGWTEHALGDPALGSGGRAPLSARGREAWVSWTQIRTGADGTQESAALLRRRDAQGRWTTPELGERLWLLPRADDPQPLLAPTGEGLVVWTQGREDGADGVALGRQAPGEDEVTGPASAADLLSPASHASSAPGIAVGSNGDGVIVWAQAEGSSMRVSVRERIRIDGTFSDPSPDRWVAPPSSREVGDPVVAIGRFGEALVFWSQAHPTTGAMGLYAAARDGFGQWQTPESLDQTFGPLREDAASIDVAISVTAEAHVAWLDGAPGETIVYGAHRASDGAWDDPRTEALSRPDAVAAAPRLAVGPDGEAAVVWSETVGGRWRVMARRRGPRGTRWGEPTQLSDDADGDAIGPTVAIGSDGTLVAAWTAGQLDAQTVRVARLP